MRHIGGVESLRVLLGDQAGVEVAGQKARVLHQRRLKGDIRCHAANHELVQCIAHAANCLIACRGMHDQLGNHRIVEHRNLAAFIHAGIDAHAVYVGWRHVLHQAAGGRQETAEGIFGIDAAFHRPAVEFDLVLREGQLLPGRHPDHQFHEVHPGNQFGHRMLDLQPRIHFQEIEALVLADHELHGPGALVLHRPGQSHRLLAHRLARNRIDKGGGRLFDHLLVSALQRTFTLLQIDGIAVCIGDQLDLYVARLLDELLDENPVVAKGIFRFGLAGGKTFMGLLVVEGHAQALAAAAGGCLDHHRVADALCNLHRLFGCVDRRVVAGYGIDLGLQRQFLRGDLVAHRGHRVVFGADENDAAFFQPARELRILGEEAVTRMHGLGTGRLAGSDDLVDQQIGFLRRRRADADGFVRQRHVHGILVRLGIHRDGGNPHLAGGLDDAAGDLAPICNQNLLEHETSFSHRGHREHRGRSAGFSLCPL